MFELGAILAHLVAAQPNAIELVPSPALSPAAELVDEQIAKLETNREWASDRREPSYAERVLRHMRGAPGTLYNSRFREIDRRLDQLTRE
jgi:hypothetical protein